MASSKRVRLYIDADSAGVTKGVGQAQRSLKGFEGQAKRSSSVMGGLSTSASSLGLAFGAAGLAIGVKSSIDAFKEQEKSTAKVIAQLKTLGVNTAAVRKQIEDTTKAQSKLSGIQDEELQASFTSILRVTGDVTQSLKLNALAMDISKGSGKGLGVVATALAKVLDGNVAALGRYGVKAQKGASITDVLALAQKRYAGQAKEFGDTTAGAADKANAQINELQESIGAKLAPAMNQAAGATIGFANATQSVIDQAGGLGPVLAGGAGFGAFKLLGPSIGNAGAALGQLGKVAGTQGAGASFRVLGSAVGASINPMTAAAVGAGLLAAGVYELWHNSDNAESAIRSLNGSIQGLNSALDQKTAAEDAVKNARDIAKTSGDAALAARNHTAALRSQRSELERHNAGSSELASLSKKITKAEQAESEAIHANERAHHQLASAQRNVKAASDGVKVASDQQAASVSRTIGLIEMMTRDVRVAGRSGVIWKNQMADSATNAALLASKLDSAAAATRRTDSALSKTDSNLAAFIRNVQRLPTRREVRIVTEMSHANKDLDQILAKLGRIQNKNVTVRFNQTFGARVNPLTGLKRSSGGMVPGSYGQGDVVPAMLSGQEAVLNPQQIAMVDSGMSVMTALQATGAPTGGGFYAPGKRPTGYVRSNFTGLKRTTPGVSAQAQAAIEKRKTYFGLQLAMSDQDLANAQGTDMIDDDIAAYTKDTNARKAYRNWLGRVLKNAGKELGFPSYKLTAAQRTDLINEQTSQTRAINDDARAVFDLLHADTGAGDAGTAGGDAGSGGDAAGPAVYDPTADLQAQLAQKEQAIATLTRSNNLSGAALTAFGSSGDIGTGNFANAMNAAKGGPMLVLGDFRSVAAFAGAAAQGFGNQPSISANAASVRV